MLNFRRDYNKALKVINSCETYYQLLGAERYIQNLINTHSTKDGAYITFHYQASAEFINYLLKKLEEKKENLFIK